MQRTLRRDLKEQPLEFLTSKEGRFLYQLVQEFDAGTDMQFVIASERIAESVDRPADFVELLEGVFSPRSARVRLCRKTTAGDIVVLRCV